MSRTRLAVGAVISAALLALAGCATDSSTAQWHASGSDSGLAAQGGQGGGEPVSHAMPGSGNGNTAGSAKPSTSTTPSTTASAPTATSPSASASAATSSA